MTQQELADALGVSRQTVADWETGRSVPKLTIPQTKILCRVLGITLVEQIPDFALQPIHDVQRPATNGAED